MMGWIMNNRLRFRAWNKEKNIMHYEAEKGAACLPFNYLIKSDEFICEQCTGLKDKNGRLIYEGDIVRVKNIYLTNNNFKGKVCYGHFYFSACEEYTCRRLGYFIKGSWSAYVKNTGFALGEGEREYEVIGNVHENPELLEAENGK